MEPSPQIPFWLQLTSLVAAPVLGLAGVAVGAFLTHRAEQARLLRNDRRDAYQALLEHLTRIAHELGAIAPRMIRSPEEDAARGLLDEIHTNVLALQGARTRVELVASSAAADAAGEAVARALVWHGVALSMAAPSHTFDRRVWSGLQRDLDIAINDLLMAAMADLGVPASERSRRWEGLAPITDEEYEGLIRGAKDALGEWSEWLEDPVDTDGEDEDE